MVQTGNKPNLCILDNEASDELKNAFTLKEITYQLVPPHCHRANAAERAIQTFKSHFKSILALLDPTFPISEWDRLLPQAEITLNLLRVCRSNPNLSAYAYLFGQYDYNKTPLVPPGIKILAFDDPSTRASWGPNGQVGFVIGPAMQHYRCLRAYFPTTRSEQTVHTVKFFPLEIPIPRVQIEDFL